MQTCCNRWIVLPLMLVVGAVVGVAAWAAGEGDAPAFSSQTIDLGLVVTDVEKSAKFYQEVVGFQAAGGFDVPAALATDVGLTDNQPFRVSVFTLGTEKTATKLKLFSFPNVEIKKNDTTFIHSTLGVRYLTIFVPDLKAAVAKAKKAGANPIAKGPVMIPESIAKGMGLVVIRDPDGNMVELVGPN